MKDFDNEKCLERMNKFSKAINEFGKKLVKALRPLCKAIHNLWKKIWDGLWKTYRQVGMPYGETDDGLLLWWKDACQAHHVKEAIERDLAWKRIM